ncbi:MAG: proteasome accessory factor PafA2 family protein [Armatimonadota bacterium]|nr:proteasome accessory factor PafA2 family protein [Armatimonadota bacterium]
MTRLFGIETEYGLLQPGGTPRSQVEDSRRLVAGCDEPHAVGWDYSFESPRNDLRGFRAASLQHDPVDAVFDQGRSAAPIEDERSDRILINGARFYNDHGHPEYATPECSRLLDLVAHDRAGERIAFAAAKKVGATLYKNNSDYSGASYGTHENYLVPRQIGFDALASGLLPLLVCRQIFTGAGKVGSEAGRDVDFQLSQRADFLNEVASVDTLYRRPIFNTRDEPHADAAQWTRFHVICGDANRSEWATAMKVGMVRIALELIALGEAPTWRLADPVRAFSDISKDAARVWKIDLDHGSWTTAPDVLETYLAAAAIHLAGIDAETDWILAEWNTGLTDIRTDPLALADRVDWVAKLNLLRAYANDVGKWEIDALRSVEMEYHDIDPETSLFDLLLGMGSMLRLVPEVRIEDSMTCAPTTRAAHRSKVVAEHADRVEAIGWRRAVVAGKVIEFEIEGTP